MASQGGQGPALAPPPSVDGQGVPVPQGQPSFPYPAPSNGNDFVSCRPWFGRLLANYHRILSFLNVCGLTLQQDSLRPPLPVPNFPACVALLLHLRNLMAPIINLHPHSLALPLPVALPLRILPNLYSHRNLHLLTPSNPQHRLKDFEVV